MTASFRVTQLNVWGILIAFAMTAVIADDELNSEVSDDASVRLIRQLDDDSFAVRETATQELIRLGNAVLAKVRDARKSESAEVRFRAKMIVNAIIERDLEQQFALLANADGGVDIERGMWLIARIVDPEVRRDGLQQRLDALATAVRKSLGDDVDPAELEPAQAVAALQKVIFQDRGFDGNSTSYDDPANSSIDRVLTTRRGLPILLSHLVMAVGRRLEIPMVGLRIPGRYMCKYDGRRAPGGPSGDVMLDPFGGGRIVTAAQLKRERSSFDPEVHLTPDTHRSALRRMLRNLANDYDGLGQRRKAARVRAYEELFAVDYRKALP